MLLLCSSLRIFFYSISWKKKLSWWRKVWVNFLYLVSASCISHFSPLLKNFPKIFSILVKFLFWKNIEQRSNTQNLCFYMWQIHIKFSNYNWMTLFFLFKYFSQPKKCVFLHILLSNLQHDQDGKFHFLSCPKKRRKLQVWVDFVTLKIE